MTNHCLKVDKRRVLKVTTFQKKWHRSNLQFSYKPEYKPTFECNGSIGQKLLPRALIRTMVHVYRCEFCSLQNIPRFAFRNKIQKRSSKILLFRQRGSAVRGNNRSVRSTDEVRTQPFLITTPSMTTQFVILQSEVCLAREIVFSDVSQ